MNHLPQGSLFIYLINHKEIMDKMVAEIRENPITDFKSLNKLKYTEMVIWESLRMAPVLLRGTRWVNKPMYVGKYWIPADCQFQYSQYVLHRNPEHWPNPREFIPERFENGIPSVDLFTFFPFLAGARTCLGKHVAMVAMKICKPPDAEPVIAETNEIDAKADSFGGRPEFSISDEKS